MLSACRPRSMSYASPFRYSKRSSVVRSWRYVVYRRLGHGSSVRSPAKLPPSTLTATSASNCVTVRCLTPVLALSMTCASRPRLERMTSTVNRRSLNSLVQHATKASPPSSEFLAVCSSSLTLPLADCSAISSSPFIYLQNLHL